VIEMAGKINVSFHESRSVVDAEADGWGLSRAVRAVFAIVSVS
jgi:hypothetical protein